MNAETRRSGRAPQAMTHQFTPAHDAVTEVTSDAHATFHEPPGQMAQGVVEVANEQPRRIGPAVVRATLIYGRRVGLARVPKRASVAALRKRLGGGS